MAEGDDAPKNVKVSVETIDSKKFIVDPSWFKETALETPMKAAIEDNEVFQIDCMAKDFKDVINFLVWGESTKEYLKDKTIVIQFAEKYCIDPILDHAFPLKAQLRTIGCLDNVKASDINKINTSERYKSKVESFLPLDDISNVFNRRGNLYNNKKVLIIYPENNKPIIITLFITGFDPAKFEISDAIVRDYNLNFIGKTENVAIHKNNISNNLYISINDYHYCMMVKNEIQSTYLITGDNFRRITITKEKKRDAKKLLRIVVISEK